MGSLGIPGGCGVFVAAVLAGTAFAAETPAAPAGGHHSPGGAGTGALHSPYSGARDVQATGLLPDEVEGLTKGSGMTLALAAEVNGYPGPRHVLDAADAGQLTLRPEQRQAVQGLFDRMSAEAKGKGQEILTAEAHLATRFRHAHVDEPTLRGLLEQIGTLRAALRFIHLRTHLETKALLTPVQVARYNAVRGYDGSGGEHGTQRH